MKDRRSHNHGQIVAFLDQSYPSSMPGSPDPQAVFDDNKKTSRVIVKGPAWRRIDSALGGKDEEGNVVDRELARSYALLLCLFDRYYDDERLATRFVLMNVNTAGGHEELLRVEELGRKNPDAKAVARLCRRVIRDVLDELDRREYWLGWGMDAEVRERRGIAGDRRRSGSKADAFTGLAPIRAYRELMVKTGSTSGEAEELTAEHFGCKVRKVRYAVAAGPRTRVS